MALGDLQDLAAATASKYSLDPTAVAAIITVESRWIPNSAKFEPNFPYIDRASFYAKIHGVDVVTETAFQSTSWGLMHVMGGTARGLGYTGWLPDICHPEIGIDLGCKYFAQKCKKYSRLEDQFAAYNAGSVTMGLDGTYRNPDVRTYVKRAMAAYLRY